MQQWYKSDIVKRFYVEVRSEVKEEIKHSFIINAFLEGVNYTFIATISKTPVKEVENIVEKYLAEKKKAY